MAVGDRSTETVELEALAVEVEQTRRLRALVALGPLGKVLLVAQVSESRMSVHLVVVEVERLRLAQTVPRREISAVSVVTVSRRPLLARLFTAPVEVGARTTEPVDLEAVGKTLTVSRTQVEALAQVLQVVAVARVLLFLAYLYRHL